MKTLCEAYPSRGKILKCLMRESDSQPQHDSRHRKLASLLLAAEQECKSLFWTFKMEWKFNFETIRENTYLYSGTHHAPQPILGLQEQRYWLSLQYDFEGGQ